MPFGGQERSRKCVKSYQFLIGSLMWLTSVVVWACVGFGLYFEPSLDALCLRPDVINSIKILSLQGLWCGVEGRGRGVYGSSYHTPPCFGVPLALQVGFLFKAPFWHHRPPYCSRLQLKRGLGCEGLMLGEGIGVR